MIKSWNQFMNESKVVDDDVLLSIFSEFGKKPDEIIEYDVDPANPYYIIKYDGINTRIIDFDGLLKAINDKLSHYLNGYKAVYRVEETANRCLVFFIYDEKWLKQTLDKGVKILNLDLDMSRYYDPNMMNKLSRVMLNGYNNKTISVVSGELISSPYEAWCRSDNGVVDGWEDPIRYWNRLELNADLIETQLKN
jgi:hypothetical protein